MRTSLLIRILLPAALSVILVFTFIAYTYKSTDQITRGAQRVQEKYTEAIEWSYRNRILLSQIVDAFIFSSIQGEWYQSVKIRNNAQEIERNLDRIVRVVPALKEDVEAFQKAFRQYFKEAYRFTDAMIHKKADFQDAEKTEEVYLAFHALGNRMDSLENRVHELSLAFRKKCTKQAERMLHYTVLFVITLLLFVAYIFYLIYRDVYKRFQILVRHGRALQ